MAKIAASQTEPVIELSLSLEELAFLDKILYRVGGDPDYSPRKLQNALSSIIQNFVYSDLNSYFKNVYETHYSIFDKLCEGGSISFKEYES